MTIRSSLRLALAVSFALACRRPAAAVLPPPAPLSERVAGYACTTSSTTALPPGRLIADARDALVALGAPPARVDSAAGRVTVGGPSAPPGRGGPALAASRLYLDLVVAPGPGGGSTYTLSPGIYSVSADLPAGELDQLYDQAVALELAFAARLPGRPLTPCVRPR